MIKRHLPLFITMMVFVASYLFCSMEYPAFFSTRVICNILTDNAFLGIVAVGMTFVILSGGIDLSVGSVIAFTGISLAKLIGDYHISPYVAIVMVLCFGTSFGAFMGWIIQSNLEAFRRWPTQSHSRYYALYCGSRYDARSPD